MLVMALDPDTLAHFKEVLIGERDEVAESLASLVDSRNSDGGYDSNFADISQVTAEKGEADALVQPLKETLAEINNALERVSQGTYGLCMKCGKDISTERLEAIPKAKYCAPCANSMR